VKLTILREAEFESAEAAAWYDDWQAGLGDDFLSEVTDAFSRIASNPQSFSRLESYAGRYDVRRYILHRFPYLVVFACRPSETLIVAIAHTRRRPLYWLERLR
jgi:toxin ParE1/3/4